MNANTQFARSADGVRIAYETAGTGPAVVLVGAALSDRKDHRRLAQRLSSQFTVVNYDRRGRGGSEGHAAADFDREFSDLAAVIEAIGGTAAVFGSSSGAVLAFRAAGHLGTVITRIVGYEPPLILDDSRPPVTAQDYLQISQLLADKRHAAAVRYFYGDIMGIPRIGVSVMRLMPGWSRTVRMAPTLRNDLAVMEGLQDGSPLKPGSWTKAAAPTLILTGSKSEQFFHHGAARLAAALGNGKAQVLPGLHHGSAAMGAPALADAITDFIASMSHSEEVAS